MNATEGPSRLPAGLTVTGELSSGQDIIIDGRFEGQITVPEREVTISSGARVNAKVIARRVVVAGRLEGSVVASARVALARTADVAAHLQTPAITIEEGAQFTGSVDPDRNAAAVQVARYRQKHGET